MTIRYTKPIFISEEWSLGVVLPDPAGRNTNWSWSLWKAAHHPVGGVNLQQYCISQMCWLFIDEHMSPLRLYISVNCPCAVDDDMLILSTIRSWTDRERTTQTLCLPPTLDFARPSRQTRRLTPLCSPEHSRTKPSMCTGSKRSARKVQRAHQSPVRLSSRIRNPVRGQRGEGLRRRTRRRRRRRRRGRDKSSESSLFLCLLSALFPAVIVAIIFSAHGSVNCGFRAMGQFKLGAALF